MGRTTSRRNQQISDLDRQIDLLRAQRERDRRALDAIYRISLACRGNTSFRDIFEAACRELQALFPLDACYIALCDTARPGFFRAVLTIDEEVADYQEGIPIGPLTGVLVAERRPLLFRDLATERRQLGADPEPFGNLQKQSRSWLGVPLLVGRDAVGVISIQSYEAGRYDASDIDLLQWLGNVIAVAIENASLAQQQRELSAALAEQVASRTVELATLSTIAGELVLQKPLPQLLDRALDLIVPLFGLEGGTVRLLDPKQHDLILVAYRGLSAEYVQASAHLPLEGSALHRVVRDHQPLVVSSHVQLHRQADLNAPYESLLSVPLSIGARVLGTLSLLGTHERTFDQQAIDLAQAIGNQLAIAIENARLFEEQQRQIGELQALGSISHAAGTARDLPTLLRLVYDAFRTFMRVDTFSMVVYDEARRIVTDGISIDEGQEYTYWRNQPPPPDSLMAWVMRHRQTLHFKNVPEEIGRYPELGEHHFGSERRAISWMGVPLVSRDGATIGAIAIQGYRPEAFDERDEAFLINVARQVALHVQNVRLLTQRERQIRELNAVGQVGQFVSASFDLDGMLQEVYETLQDVIRPSVFYLIIVEAERQVVTNAIFVEQGEWIELGWVGRPPPPNSITAWIMHQREPLLFQDLPAQHDQLAARGITPHRAGPQHPVRSWVGVPLLGRHGEPMGVLSVQDYQPNLYDEQTIDFLSQIASHISLGVQKVRLFEERERQLDENVRLFAEAQAHAAVAERQAQRMELVNRIALVLSNRLDLHEILDLASQEVVQLFRADHTGTVLFDASMEWGTVVAEYPSSGMLISPIPLTNNALVEELLATRRPVNILSTETDPRAATSRAAFRELGITSLMIAPLVSRGRVIGSISVDSVGRPRIFNEDEQSLFLTIAASIAAAVENARLFAAEQAAHRTADTLHEVARVLSSSFDPREVLELILRELQHVIAYDTASIMLLERDELRTVAIRGLGGPAEVRHTVVEPALPGAAQVVVRRRQPIVIPDTSRSPDWVSDETTGYIRSWLGVPLIAKGAVLGVLNIDSRQTNHFTARDVEVAQAFASQAAVALENARLYEESVTRVEQELEIAGRIQSNLFPPAVPHINGLELDARCLPARETGGDFYDFIDLTDGQKYAGPFLGLVVGDASGKSIPGAMLMAIARSIVRSEARDHQTPQVVMRETNHWIVRDVPPRSFVALCYATLDVQRRRLALTNAGQLTPLRRRADGHIEYLEVPGTTLPLGIMPDMPYAVTELTLEQGDLLLFFTDGIVEARNNDQELFGFERLEALVRTYGDLPPRAIIDRVLEAIAGFMDGAPQHDDMTLVTLRIA